MDNRALPVISFFGKESFFNFDFAPGHFGFEWAIIPGHKVMEHIHPDTDEYFEITKGEITFKVSGKKIVKKAGERLEIPRGTPHEITNEYGSESGCRVRYTPIADQDKFMRVCLFLLHNYPEINGRMPLMLKAFYLNRKLGYKDFSIPATAGGRLMVSVLMMPTNLMAFFGGWGKLANVYRSQMLHDSR